jgi:hypothetical protein
MNFILAGHDTLFSDDSLFLNIVVNAGIIGGMLCSQAR